MFNRKNNEPLSKIRHFGSALRPKGVSSVLLDVSQRDLQILAMLNEGKTIKEIALQLNVSQTTVATYRVKLASQIGEAVRHVPNSQDVQRRTVWVYDGSRVKPPMNAEYLLYLFLRPEEREFVIGDLVEGYIRVLNRFDKRRADIWYYKQVFGSLWPLFRRAVLKISALVWLGRLLRRLIS